MAKPTFPFGFRPTGTTWRTIGGSVIHRLRGNGLVPLEMWACTGCGLQSEKTRNFSRPQISAAQAHADTCSAQQR